MLTSIENFFGELLDLQEQLPEDTIAEFEKKLEKDRRARLREEKIKEQEALQRERVRRALERAQGIITSKFYSRHNFNVNFSCSEITRRSETCAAF